ncbi:uncharacterized protein [Haliotis asinina]|uniref:uncharacterized protein isoform X3 n=1 Tax=Haliotis asinina TaxID=109174 RepID=UPI003532438C
MAGSSCILAISLLSAAVSAIPSTKPINPCAVVRCEAGTVCKVQTVKCVKAPCPKLPRCVPTDFLVQRLLLMEDQDQSCSRLKYSGQCCDGVKSWMTTQKLKLNNNKTECIFFSPESVESTHWILTIHVSTLLIK